MSGYISRSKLIKDVENLKDCYNGFSDTYDKACIIGLIAEQPSVERKHGKWVEHGEPNAHGKYEVWYYDCSLCGQVGIQQYNFCPNCGAQMESGGE